MTYDQALQAWQGNRESAEWSEVVDILVCQERPKLIWPNGNSHEAFEILDTATGRIVSNEELPDEQAQSLDWRPLAR